MMGVFIRSEVMGNEGNKLESSASVADWEQRLGYAFQEPEFLVRALTHRSFLAQGDGGPEDASNEQMEFLGDAILGFLVSEALVERFPAYQEGRLSKLKARLVSTAHLVQVAQRMALGQFLRLGKGEEQSGGRSKKTLLADALEAVIAALYLDGGMDPARHFVERWVLGLVDWERFQITDYKSELQELLQEWRASQPRYVVVRERGPEHCKVFTVQVRVGSEHLAQAEGDTKKAAQQAAARIALAKLKERQIVTKD